MKFLFFKSKKVVMPSLESLRPPLFRVEFFWVASLLVFVLSIIVNGLVGFFLFYNEYTENYKDDSIEVDPNHLINGERLKNIIDKRNEFISQPTPELRDPSK